MSRLDRIRLETGIAWQGFPAQQGLASRDEFAQDSPHLLGVRFGLDCRVEPAETSCPTTPPTAIECAEAETFPEHPEMDREIHAIPRDFGD